jgi:hypothetical protein
MATEEVAPVMGGVTTVRPSTPGPFVPIPPAREPPSGCDAEADVLPEELKLSLARDDAEALALDAALLAEEVLLSAEPALLDASPPPLLDDDEFSLLDEELSLLEELDCSLLLDELREDEESLLSHSGVQTLGSPLQA